MCTWWSLLACWLDPAHVLLRGIYSSILLASQHRVDWGEALPPNVLQSGLHCLTVDSLTRGLSRDPMQQLHMNRVYWLAGWPQPTCCCEV
jgi:hypothetical protein